MSANLAFRGGTDRANARLSLGAENVEGYIPNNKFQKISGLLSGTMQVTPKFSADATLQYISNDARNRPGVGYNSGILEQFIWFGRQVDTSQLKAKRFDEDGNLYNWNYNYHNNPYWIQYENPESDNRDRFIGVGSLRYSILPWLDATFRGGSDLYRLEHRPEVRRRETSTTPIRRTRARSTSRTTTATRRTSTSCSAANRQLTSKIDFNGTFGLNRRAETFSSKQQYDDRHFGAAHLQRVERRDHADVSARPTPDDASTACSARRPPPTVAGSRSKERSATTSRRRCRRGTTRTCIRRATSRSCSPRAIPALRSNDALVREAARLDRARRNGRRPVRAPHDVHGTRRTSSPALPLFGLGNTIANANLKPELTTSNEAGVELGFFNGRISLDATYYAKSTKNQILNLTRVADIRLQHRGDQRRRDPEQGLGSPARRHASAPGERLRVEYERDVGARTAARSSSSRETCRRWSSAERGTRTWRRGSTSRTA